MEPLTLDGRCAIVTGAASGIGRALVIDAIGRGMTVAACDVDAAGLDRLAIEIGRSDVLLTRQVDIGSADAVAAFAAQVADWSPSIALVFANAGIMPRTDSLRPDLAAWNATIDVNLRGTVHMVAAFLGRMIDSGEAGQFVLTASQAAFTAAPMISPYIATKHALWGLAQCLRQDLAAAGSGVGVSLLAPGRVRSGLTAESRRLILERDGEAAAAAYDAVLLAPETVAKTAIDRAAAREFWMTPSRESVVDYVKSRFDETAQALADGLVA